VRPTVSGSVVPAYRSSRTNISYPIGGNQQDLRKKELKSGVGKEVQRGSPAASPTEPY
jgi:hypothetical protein